MTNTNIYLELKRRILAGNYSIKMRLPTEDTLIEEFHTSRYAIRKSIQQLADDGLVCSIKGKGVMILENALQSQKINLNFDKIDDLQSTNQDFELDQQIKVIDFKLQIVDEDLSNKTLFHLGLPVYAIKRIRNIKNRNLVLDINYFNAQLIPGLTKEIAEDSIYSYIKKQLNMNISVVKKQLRIEPATDLDYANLSLGQNNCVGNMISFAFNSDGKQFEYTESHYIPDNFIFNQIITF